MTSGPQHDHEHGREGARLLVQDQAFWDERYRSHGQLWSGNPNAHLVTEVPELTPGTALDVGCGEGADAIWLAEHGWLVTAVDLSAVALERAASHALEVGADVAQRITWLHVNVTEWTPAARSFDLVSAQFMQLSTAKRELLHRRLAESVASGGTLLIVGHHPSDMDTTVPRPRMPELFFTAADVAAGLNSREWELIVEASRERQATDPAGETVAIHDAVLRARRRS